MIGRISSVGLALALVTALLPVQVFADESRPLASLKTAEGLNSALQAGKVANAQDPTRRAGGGVQVQRQQNGNFFTTTPGRVVLIAALAVGAYFAIDTWDGPTPARADTPR